MKSKPDVLPQTSIIASDSRNGHALPTVSVMAICYNQSKYLAQCLTSIAAQTFRDFELIIIDDCSNDTSVETIHSWLARTEQEALFITHTVNQGVVKTLNDALSYVRAEFVSLVAIDDILEPEKLALQVGLLKSDANSGFVYSDAHLINSEGARLSETCLEHFGRVPSEVSLNKSRFIFLDLLKGMAIPPLTMMIRTRALREIGGFDEGLAHEDGDFQLRLAYRYSVIYSDYVSATVRLHSDSLSATTPPVLLMQTRLAMLRKWLGISREIDRIIRPQLIHGSYWLLDAGDPSAREELRAALRDAPCLYSWAIVTLAKAGVPFTTLQHAAHAIRALRRQLVRVRAAIGWVD